MKHPPDPENRCTREILAEGRYLRLLREGEWEYVERVKIHGVVAVVAVTPAGNLLLIEQYRTSMRAPVIELPAGLAGDEDRREIDLAAAAIRELLEETGYAAGRVELLTEGPSSSGLSNEVVTYFRARDLVKRGGGGGVGGERITVHEVPLAGAGRWLEARAGAGACIDPRIYIGLYFAVFCNQI